jgi:hypothetical protein
MKSVSTGPTLDQLRAFCLKHQHSIFVRTEVGAGTEHNLKVSTARSFAQLNPEEQSYYIETWHGWGIYPSYAGEKHLPE